MHKVDWYMPWDQYLWEWRHKTDCYTVATKTSPNPMGATAQGWPLRAVLIQRTGAGKKKKKRTGAGPWYPLNKLVIWRELPLWKGCNSEWGRGNLGWSNSLWPREICGEELKFTISSQNSQWLGNQYLSPAWRSTWHTSIHSANSPFSLGWQRVPLYVLQVRNRFSYLPEDVVLWFQSL